MNAILNSFFTKEQNDGIAVSFTADTAEKCGIADMDWAAILSE